MYKEQKNALICLAIVVVSTIVSTMLFGIGVGSFVFLLTDVGVALWMGHLWYKETHCQKCGARNPMHMLGCPQAGDSINHHHVA